MIQSEANNTGAFVTPGDSNGVRTATFDSCVTPTTKITAALTMTLNRALAATVAHLRSPSAACVVCSPTPLIPLGPQCICEKLLNDLATAVAWQLFFRIPLDSLIF